MTQSQAGRSEAQTLTVKKPSKAGFHSGAASQMSRTASICSRAMTKSRRLGRLTCPLPGCRGLAVRQCQDKLSSTCIHSLRACEPHSSIQELGGPALSSWLQKLSSKQGSPVLPVSTFGT